MSKPVVLAHQYQRFETFLFSTQEFYRRLTNEIGPRDMPDVCTRRGKPEFDRKPTTRTPIFR
jgi:hypothetical protein